ASDNEKRDSRWPSPASDNEKRSGDLVGGRSLTVFDLAGNKGELQSVYRAPSGFWREGKVILEGNGERDEIVDGKVAVTPTVDGEVVAPENPFAGVRNRPSQLTIAGLKEQIAQSDSSAE